MSESNPPERTLERGLLSADKKETSTKRRFTVANVAVLMLVMTKQNIWETEGFGSKTLCCKSIRL